MSGSRGASGHGKRWQRRNDIRALLRLDVAKAVHQETAALREMLRQDSTTQTKLLELIGQMHAETIAVPRHAARPRHRTPTPTAPSHPQRPRPVPAEPM